jgi:mannose-6-phosphate isomerase-like protein (cupin superfamily)
VSTSLLSKIERGLSVPSLPTLQTIAIALEVKLTYFFPRQNRSTPALTRLNSRVFLPESPREKNPAFQFESLNFSAIEPVLHCYRACFQKNVRSRTHAHAGNEFLFVVTGTLEVTVVEERHLLEEGDSIYFDSGLSHSYMSTSDAPCSVLVITLPDLPAVLELDDQATRDTLRIRENQILLRNVG